MERNFAARKVIGDSRIVDVYYDDIRDRPLDVIAEIYSRWGRPLTEQALQAFKTWNESRPEGYRGKYKNESERTGVSKGEIEVAFAAYLNRFPRLTR